MNSKRNSPLLIAQIAGLFLRSRFPMVMARGLALFLGGFTLLNLCGELLWKGFDANLWWIDVRAFPHRTAQLILGLSALFLLTFAFHPRLSTWRKNVTFGCAGVLATISFANAISYYLLLARGEVHSSFPLPVSVLISITLVCVAFVILRTSSVATPFNPAAPLSVAIFAAALFTVTQMFAFGKTDYRRSADIAVVFGARVYSDGRLSDALADRVATACELYHKGYTHKLLMSGGPGDGAIDEPTAMKNAAVKLGVRAQDILLDHAGLNTNTTARNTEDMFAELHFSSVLVVSHFYHLPRVKMAYARLGREVYTVPAKESYFLRQMPYNMVREVAALWVYYFKPIVS